MGDNGNMKAKEPRISVRVDNALKARIEAICNKTGVDEADIVRNCIIALCDSVEKNGTITFPLQITSGKDKGCGTDVGCAGHPEETKFSANETPAPAPAREIKPVSYSKPRK